MREVLKAAGNRVKYLSNILGELDVRKVCFEEGRLRINNSGTHTRYYQVTEKNDTSGKYLGKNKLETARRLAQNDYEHLLRCSIESEKDYLERFIKKYPVKCPEEVYERLSAPRRSLIDPLILPDDLFVERWKNQKYERLGFRSDDETSYYTGSGIRVRSKSEVIIINTLDHFRIPYLVERPVYLEGLGIVYPDLFLLNVRTRTEYYWEHYGMLDDRDYRENSFLRKNEAYLANGYFLGINLIQTFESQKHPLAVPAIESIIRRYLM